MKIKLFACAVLSGLCCLVSAAEAPAAPAPQPPPAATAATTTDHQEISWSANGGRMGRGVVNIVTCWMEIPRCMLYDNSEVPLWGFVSGVFEGAGCTAMRGFAGVVDVISLGFDRGKVYDDAFREYVWESRWLPTEVKR